jgi:hypothetical protein
MLPKWKHFGSFNNKHWSDFLALCKDEDKDLRHPHGSSKVPF